jgi:hypothetical protein
MTLPSEMPLEIEATGSRQANIKDQATWPIRKIGVQQFLR